MKKKLVKQVFTFGCGQKYKGRYVVIFAKTKALCRRQMFERFGAKWCWQYDNEKQAGVKKWGLKRLE